MTIPAQDCYIRILHLRDCLWPAKSTADQTVGGFNRGILPQIVRNRPREANLPQRRPCQGYNLTLARPRQRLAWVRTLARWRNTLFSDKSCFLLHRADMALHKGSGMLTSSSYEGWHTVAEAHWLGWEYLNDIAQNSMSLLEIWMLSDTAMRYCARSSRPSFDKTTPFSNMTMPQLTSPASAERFQMTKTSDCFAWLSSIFYGFVPNNLGRPGSGISSQISASGKQWPTAHNTPGGLKNIPQVTIDNLVMSMQWRCAAVCQANGGHIGYWLCDIDVSTNIPL